MKKKKQKEMNEKLITISAVFFHWNKNNRSKRIKIYEVIPKSDLEDYKKDLKIMSSANDVDITFTEYEPDKLYFYEKNEIKECQSCR